MSYIFVWNEYVVLEEYENGAKKITFSSRGGETFVAKPDELNGRFKERCERIIQKEKERVWRDIG